MLTRVLSDIRPRALRPAEEPEVRWLFAACHPELPPRPEGWYAAYPTLVIAVDRRVVAFTSFSISPAPTGPTTLYGNDLCVAPEIRRIGLGRGLVEARGALARRVGATTFIGIAQATNEAMRRIFEGEGFHPCQRLAGYWAGADAVVWAGPL